MSESMWDEETTDGFELPGDEQRLAAAAAVQEPEQQQQQQSEPEPAAEQAAEEPAADEPPALIGGKFKTVDELLKSYQELERNRGQMANELGELRKTVDQIQQQPTPPPFYGYGPSDEQIDQQPVEIAQWALQNGDENTYMRAIQAMYDSADPQLAVQATRLELARGTAPLYQELQELRAQAGKQQADQGIEQWAKEHPDFDRHQARMVELAQANPDIQRTLELGNPAAARLVLDHLYTIAASEARQTPENFAQAVRDAASNAARDAQQEAADAAVLQAGKAASEAPKLTAAEKLGQQWAEIDAAYDGWNV